ncbi:MAG: glycosyltransferase [Tenuifilaceae bacterium]|jgi:glycosyltransferase involved in cell wall biosynthesis|nr:glycosyltransferase [Tenuifilaceae bacterium]
MENYFFSLIIPVYNRPDEVDELLQSLSKQTRSNFEVVIVEDGSTVPCKHIVDKYAQQLDIKYFSKPNSGPGTTRNYGAERANGNYFIFFDSDCIIPESYLTEVDTELQTQYVDAFGGPDRAHPSFTNLQKSINYSMTSFFTTGGIRGGKEKMDKFHPRSFNMGISKAAFEATGGYSAMRFGEDVDFSLRLVEAGYSTKLFPKAFVYHKRRTDFRKFFRQVYNSGIARINLYLLHPKSLKLVHTFPSLFTIGSMVLLLGAIVCKWALLPLVLFCTIIFVDSLRENKNLKVALLSVPASFIQLTGYGTGFIQAFWKRILFKSGEFKAFEKNFYK